MCRTLLRQRKQVCNGSPMISKKFFTAALLWLLFFHFCSSHGGDGRLGNHLSTSPETRFARVSPDLEIIRARIIDDLLEPALDEERVRSLIKSVRHDGSWPDINYTDLSRTGFDHARHLDNMFQLARAYKKSGSPWFQNPAVKTAALTSLDYWLVNDFICDNWWWNEMGTPGRLINTLLVLDTDLNENQMRKGLRIAGRANLEASGARPGGDLIQIAAMLGKQALFRRDETILRRVVEVMADQIRVTTGRGLKPDMSFHHRVDNVISTLSYGLGYARSFAYWAVKIAGTKYNFPERATELLIDYYLDGICKSMVHGTYPDPGAKNRDLSRKGTLNPLGVGIAENLLAASDYRKAELQQIISIRNGERKPDLVSDTFFWHSEYFTHQRPGYFASVRMHSARNHTMEQPHNEEGLKMHHVADGSNFVSQSGREYLDIFPVWDWQKIPGATIVQKPALPHWKEIARKGLTEFVGAVSDGKYGAVAMDFKSAHDPLSARKAWFFYDDEYVCLGAGITSTAEYPVFTTLNQCLLSSEVIVKSRKQEITLQKGVHSISNATWIFHDGVGYLFPKPQNAGISNRQASGKWNDINHQSNSSGEVVHKDVFTLWLNHGFKPEGASYEYIVVPATDRSTLYEYTRNTPVEILANSESVQAVRHNGLHRTDIVFYKPGTIKVSDHVTLQALSPCVVMVTASERSIQTIAVSDPGRKLASLKLKTSALLEGQGDNWEATWDKKEKESTIVIDLPQEGYAGQSVVLNISLPQ